MDDTYKLGSNVSCVRRNVMDNLLVCWLANLFIEWPLAFTEVHVLSTLISQSTIVLEKMQYITFYPFNIPRDQIWPWQKWVMVNIQSTDATYLFLPYMGWGPCWSCDYDHLNKSQILILSGCCVWNLIEIGQAVSEKLFENVDKHSIRVTLGQGHWITLAFGIYRSGSYHRIPLFSKNTMFHLFSIQKPKGPNLTLMKNWSWWT